MSMRWSLLGFCLVSFGCIEGSAPELPSPPQPVLPGLSGDTVLEHAPRREALSPGAPSPNLSTEVLYLSFAGETLTAGGDNAPANQSSILSQTPTSIPKFNAALNAPLVTEQDAINAVFDRVRTFYLPYNITITRARPVSNFTMITVGGKNTLLGATNAAGVAPLDCNDTNPNNVVFSFSDESPPDQGGVVYVAIAAAHEAGHSFGLEHTDYEQDIMFSVDPNVKVPTVEDLFANRFSVGNYSGFNASSGNGNPRQCGRPDPLNNDDYLKTKFGARPTAGLDTVKPTLDWTFPPPSAQSVPLTIPIAVTATDDKALSRVEIYKNLELIAVLKSAPFAYTLKVADKDAFYLTIEAIDATANRTSQTRIFSADAKLPTLCQTQAACSTGRTCSGGFCKLPFGQTCTQAIECVTNLCKAFGGASTKICSDSCTASKMCPTGGKCEGGLCNLDGTTPPVLKATGDPCVDETECLSGRCQDTCLDPCDPSVECVDGTVCADVLGGMGCVPADAPPPKKGCGYAGRAPSPSALPLLLLTLALLLAHRKFRDANS